MKKNPGKIGIIGAGVMGQAVAEALLRKGLVSRKSLWAVTRSRESAEEVRKKLGITCYDRIDRNLPAQADVIILAVKPFQAPDVLRKLAECRRSSGSLLISVVTGVSTGRIEQILGDKSAVIRAITNTPCVVATAMTALVSGKHVTASHRSTARAIFESVGECIEVEEKFAEAVTGLSASGPAYLYLIMEALADGGVRVGLRRDMALKIVAQTVLGAATMVKESGRHPASLRDDVTTPAGCTIAGLLVMEDGKLRSTLARAVEEATTVARELGKAAD